MNASDLQHGDVLLYDWVKNASIDARGIRLIEGSKYTHCSVVQEIEGIHFVLEQLGERMHSYLPFYYAETGEEITCFRPKFKAPEANQNSFTRNPYGYLSILDALINHFIGLFSNKRYKPWMMTFFKSKNVDCSILVGKVLELESNAQWCYDINVLEPDDFYRHPESFEDLGTIDWTK